MNTHFKRIIFLLSSSLLIFSCVKKTVYDAVPEIEYSSFTPYTDETADISIKFKDGDGDIGVQGTADSTKNFWVNYYYKDTITQKYVAFCYGCGTDSLKTSYGVRAPDGSFAGKPISGEISVHLQQYRHSKKIKHIKYVVYLFDKAKHKSNIITTPEITVP